MEQRIGSSSQPLEGAGFDPAFIPGLSSPASAEPEDTVPVRPGEKAAEETAPGEGAAPERAESVEDSAEAPSGAASAEPEAAPEGPVFEASDRRARIVADGRGVRLTLDDQECEFRWDEIGAVETATPRFGKRFTVTVHTPDRRWYPIEIEATAKSLFPEWEAQLDAVLDAFFEDGEQARDGEPPRDGEQPKEAEAEPAGQEA
ncbi:hypothetical protein ACF1A5_02480 [Streptomyces sp. NPDC014864]|uniref:hypothetical protein n=1 Tax=Streptomyces sp. NPDC014864 TaxID=3364924 RepID=UPI0036FF3C00